MLSFYLDYSFAMLRRWQLLDRLYVSGGGEASLSGVTFISIPGEVGNTHWTYLTLVFGNCVGYIVIALVLLPLFYRQNLVSIYSWLGTRFGEKARLTGSFFFIVSQLVGASFRLFLVVGVLQLAFFDAIGVPFWLTVLITIVFVWIYTVRGGITIPLQRKLPSLGMSLPKSPP